MMTNVKPIQLMLDGRPGYLFESETREVLVFVPEECVVTTREGELSIDQTAFFSTGWAERSALFADAQSDLERAFPDAEHPVTDENDARVKALLLRLRHAYLINVGS
jgi:hypothetical protein